MASPLGDLLLSGDGDALTGLWFPDESGPRYVRSTSSRSTSVARRSPDPDWQRDDAAFEDVTRQLRAYFAGELTTFELRLAPAGTPFQRRVWDVLLDIPYGTTTTYGRIASDLGDPHAMRAVGLANGRNPIAIVIPCHRVIGADGGLTGYGGGVHRKQWLLAHEGQALPLL